MAIGDPKQPEGTCWSDAVGFAPIASPTSFGMTAPSPTAGADELRETRAKAIEYAIVLRDALITHCRRADTRGFYTAEQEADAILVLPEVATLLARAAERDAVMAERDEAVADASLLAANQCDGPMHGDDGGTPYCPIVRDLESAFAAERAEVKRLRAALEPFVKHADRYADWLRRAIAPNPPDEAFRAARAVLTPGEPDAERP